MNNSYDKNNDILNSFYRSYKNRFSPNKELYFITICPTKKIFTQEQANKYLDKLLPGAPSYILVLENDDKISHFKYYKDYSMLPTVHFHLIVAEQFIKHFPGPVFYKHKKELEEIKFITKKEIEIAATRIWGADNLKGYLNKQCLNDFSPVTRHYGIKAKKVFIKKMKRKTTKPTRINVLTLMQLLITGGYTYSQIIHSLKKNKVIQLKLMHSLFIEFMTGLFAKTEKQSNDLLPLKRVPFLGRMLTDEVTWNSY